jgi:hypothetical protein
MNRRQFSESYLPLAGAAVVGSAAILSATEPANAQAAPTGGDIAAVSSTVTALGGLAAAATTVVLGAMGVRLAIKLVNRVAVKG